MTHDSWFMIHGSGADADMMINADNDDIGGWINKHIT